MGLIDRLIARAKRTPYYDLPGYMERYWLVPYNQVIEREVEAVYPTFPRPGHVKLINKRIFTDGTGLVTWRRPIARLLQKLGIAVRVHHILRSDAGRDPHDHPWPFLTVILRGGYYEYRYDDHGAAKSMTWHGPGSVLFRPANTWHRLVLPENETAWTLFITGKKAQSWGFLVNGKKIGYRDYEGA